MDSASRAASRSAGLMYRETLLGTALEATLAELAATYSLTEDQNEHLWRVFDQCMDRCLAEAPAQSRVTVRLPSTPQKSAATQLLTSGRRCLATAPPTRLTESSLSDGDGEEAGGASMDGTARSEVQIDETRTLEQRQAAVMEASRALEDEAMVYPVYRCVDGVWTILLKDPLVEVRDEYGVDEQLQLDYLKVYLKDTTLTAGTAKKRGSRRHRARKA